MQKLVGNGREKEKIKIIVSFRSFPMRNRKFQTNSKKIENTVMASFQAKIRGETPRNKIIVLFRSNLTQKENSKKIGKNLKNTVVASFTAKIGWKGPRKT